MGDAWRRTASAFQQTSPRGHFTGMPTRSLHARDAVAPADNFQAPGLGGVTPILRQLPAARSGARRPAVRRATAGGRLGMRAGRRVARP